MEFRNLFTLVFILLNGTANSQNYDKYKPKVTPQSPSVAALFKFVETPVNYSTGIPSISLPMYTIQQGKLTVPVELSYHAGGIRVSDIAAEVGTGWSLSGIFSISRVINGYNSGASQSDDIYLPNNDDFNCAKNPQFLYNAASGYIDLEADEYTYVLNGISGKFFFSKTQNKFVCQPRNDLKIEQFYSSYNGQGTRVSFAITTNEGIKYIFQELGETSVNSIGPSVTNFYITNIIDLSNNSTIKFSYKPENIGYQTSQIYYTKDNSSKCPQEPYELYFTLGFSFSDLRYYTKLIDQIEFNDGLLKFNYKDRINNNLEKLSSVLESIQLKDKLNSTIRTWSLNQVYIESESYKRLFLKQLIVKNNERNDVEKYTIEYNNPDVLLPNRNSYSQDFWGFYNGKNNTNLVRKREVPYLSGGTYLVGGANREIDPFYAQAGMIKSIIYPTGGFVKFNFESNNTGTELIGGQRIKEIQYFDNSDRKIKEEQFEYSNAKLILPYSLMMEDQRTLAYGKNCTTPLNPGGLPQPTTWSTDIINAGSIYETQYYAGSPIVYQKVRKKMVGLNTNLMEEFLYDASGLEYIRVLGSNGDDFITSNSWKGADLIEHNIYSNIGNSYNKSLTKKYVYDYSDEILIHKNIKVGFVFMPNPSYTLAMYCGNFYNLYWDLKSSYKFLKSEKVINYEGISQLINEKTFNYDFSKNNISPISILQANSNQQNILIQNTYPTDLTTYPVYAEMSNRNIISPIIEQTNTNISINKVLDKVKTNYHIWNSNKSILPLEIQTSSGGNPLEVVATFKNYDESGNLKEFLGKDGIYTSYVWGYNRQYPVAKVVKADNGSVLPYINQSILDNAVGGIDDVSMRNHLNSLRTIPNALVTTYTYKPLIGLTSETDPNGRTTFYEYDSFNRLMHLKDQNGNIIKKYCYNYAGQTINCNGQTFTNTQAYSGQFQKTGCTTGFVGSTVTYTVPIGTVTSIVSAADANILAQAKVNAEGQAYANANGSCTPSSSCTPSICQAQGLAYKCVAGVCEQGFQIFTGVEIMVNGVPHCEYYYEWSDLSRSYYSLPSGGSSCLMSF